MFELTGKRALVTGASGAIGGAIARAFHRQGAIVALSGTRREALDALAGALGDRNAVLTCDLGNKDEVEKLVPDAETALGGEIDILVNNAGLNRDMLFARMSDEDWQKVIDVNLTAAFRLSRAVLRGMMRARWGRIISITSVVAVVGNPGQGNYSASKAGLIGMTKSLAAEIASRNVTVNCVAPGFTTSAMTDALNEKQRAMILDRVPSRRLGTPAEVAAAVVYLASDEAAYVTGQTIHVNGGMAMI
jgi:3-oxoacyl-[acyl-carrier protein] reductase